MGLATQADATVAVAKQLFDAANAGRSDAMAGLLHPEVIARPSIGGSPELSGRDEVLEFWAEMARTGREVEARPLDFEVRGDCVIVRGYLRHRDGRTLAENQTFWLYEIHDGQITRMESYPSRKAALAAVELSS